MKYKKLKKTIDKVPIQIYHVIVKPISKWFCTVVLRCQLSGFPMGSLSGLGEMPSGGTADAANKGGKG